MSVSFIQALHMDFLKRPMSEWGISNNSVFNSGRIILLGLVKIRTSFSFKWGCYFLIINNTIWD